MDESTDNIIRMVFKRIAKSKNIEFIDVASFFINHEWNEFISRKEFFEELNSVLLKKPIDIEKIAAITQKKGFVVHGAIGLRVQTKAFFDSDKAAELFGDLIGDGTSRPNEKEINQFLHNAIDIAFKGKDGKINKPNAALFASTILTSVFPKDFVDYRIVRWKWMSDVFHLEPVPKDSNNGAMILWAGRVAREFVETTTFKECFSEVDIEPSWCAAALTYMLHKDSELKRLAEDDEIGTKNGREENNIIMDTKKIPLNQIIYGPPGTGKTYITINKAVEICDGKTHKDRTELIERFKKLQSDGRIEFVTFHQSYSYEEFVEGIRPVLINDREGTGETDQDSVQYELHEGIFRRICRLSKNITQQITHKYDFDIAKTNIWKMSLGDTTDPSKAYIYDDCIEGNYIRLGYGKGLDYTDCNTRQEVMEKLKGEYPDIDKMDYNITSVFLFKNKMKIGDLVVVTEGNHKFRAIGKVTGEYEAPISDDVGQRRTVEWLVVYDESLPKEKILNATFSQKTLYQLKAKRLKIDALKKLLSGQQKPTIENYVLIIDEINRGNVSKILGELITLLEPDKRLREENELLTTLPYSGEVFGVPSNLYIIGTMNTADRSIAFMDTALRRRFQFEEMMPDSEVVASLVGNDGIINGINIAKILDTLNERIEILYDRDHQLGHSYFLKIDTLGDLRDIFLNNVIPLLQEYFYGDWKKLCLVLGCPYDIETGKPLTKNSHPIVNSIKLNAARIPGFDHEDLEDILRYEINQKFIEADEEELQSFFSSIINEGQNNMES